MTSDSKRPMELTPKILPYVSILFFLGALWYEGLHFGFFGINVFTYISLGDAISLFLYQIPKLLFISSIILFFFFMFQLLFRTWLARMLHVSRFNRRIRRVRVPQNMVIISLVGLVPMVLFMIVLPTLFNGIYETEEYLIFRALVFLFTIFWFSYISFAYDRTKYDNRYSSVRAGIVTFVITFFAVIYYYHRWQIWQIGEQKYVMSDNRYKITLNSNEIINCVDSVDLIGKTRDYVFLVYFRNRMDRHYVDTRIIKMDDVKEISIAKVVPWYSVFP